MADQPSEVDKLETFFEEIIQKMEHRFTSHEFLLRLAHEHQPEYVKALTHHMEKGTPFKDLHHELVKRLHHLDGKLIALHKKNYPSRDIFGIVSTASVWRKTH
jgi:hypothetical protein